METRELAEIIETWINANGHNSLEEQKEALMVYTLEEIYDEMTRVEWIGAEIDFEDFKRAFDHTDLVNRLMTFQKWVEAHPAAEIDEADYSDDIVSDGVVNYRPSDQPDCESLVTVWDGAHHTLFSLDALEEIIDTKEFRFQDFVTDHAVEPEPYERLAAIEVDADEDEVEEMLNEVYGDLNVCGYQTPAGRVLREIDPIAFSMITSSETRWECPICGIPYYDEIEAEDCCQD